MKLSRPDLAAYGLVALCAVALAVLAALRVPAPEVLQYLAVTALGIGGGVALQAPAPQNVPPAPVLVEPRPAASLPAASLVTPRPPVGYTDDPAATGVFRAATHAP